MRETRNYYTTSSNYAEDHTAFGGTISNFDFDGHPTMSDIANRIISDRKFDERCRKNIEQRNKQKNFKKGNK